MMWWNGSGSWGYVVMTLGMLIVTGIVIAGVIGLVRYSGRGVRAERDGPVAEQLLAERFAHGEIDEEEFDRRLGVLRMAGRHH